MTWTDASANAEAWGDLALTDEIQALDESGNVLTDESGGELILGRVVLWSNAAANAETWVDV